MKKRLLALLSAIVLMGSVSLAENTEESAETPATAEPMVSLPIDFSPGMPADPDGLPSATVLGAMKIPPSACR